MITVVSGKVGNGKSAHVVGMICRHLRAGGIVATNMTLFRDKIKYHWGRNVLSWQILELTAEADPRKIPRGDFRGTPGARKVLVVLDECLNWFASSESKSDPRKETWGEWLRQSDKLGQNVIFIAQEFNRAAKWLRELAQIQIDIRNLGQTMLLGMPIGKWLRLDKLYIAVTGDVRSKSVLGFAFGLLGPRVWECYQTCELYGFPASENAYSGHSIPPGYDPPALSLAVVPFLWLLVRAIFECFR